MSSWSEYAIWWQVYPLGFVGADTTRNEHGRPVHRLAQLIAWLDDLVELGCNGLALGPIFDSETHGYDTTDYFRVDPRLGDDEDFDELVRECHARGIRLLLDGVFNHVGRSFHGWQDALRDTANSPSSEWFSTVDDGSVANFEGHEHLVVLNHDSPAVVREITAAMKHWLARGIDGWRLDAAYAVDPAFWRRTVGVVRKIYPEAWFVGEKIHGDYVEYVELSGLDSLTQYELWKAIRNSIDVQNFFELDWTIRRNNELLAHFLPLTFIGNHDVTRVASAIRDERHHEHAIALLLFLPGVPSVYYGDERAMTGVKEDRAGGDDSVRPAFPADPDSLPPGPLYRAYQRWISLRRRHQWLAHATIVSEQLANRSVVLVATGLEGQIARLALNLSDDVLISGPHEVAPHSCEFFG